MVVHGLKCDMGKPVWGHSGTQRHIHGYAGGGRSQMQTGLEGVFLYGSRGKNKAEGSLQACRELAAASLAVVGRRGQRHCRSPTGTGAKWAQLSAMRAQGRQVGQRRAARGSVGCGTDSKPQEE